MNRTTRKPLLLWQTKEVFFYGGEGGIRIIDFVSNTVKYGKISIFFSPYNP
jgi:hypothetical protein